MFSAFQTFGRLGAGARAVSAAWSPLSLWPNGILSPGMWISPRDLTSQWQDYTGTTPVATPGTVADTSNPVGLALDIRAGTPVLGPELVTNGDFSDGTTGWYIAPGWGLVGGALVAAGAAASCFPLTSASVVGKTYLVTIEVLAGVLHVFLGGQYVPQSAPGTFTARFTATNTNGVSFSTPSGATVDNISVKEVPGNHMLQSTSVDRPLLSARVNLLTYSEALDNAAWASGVNGCTTYATKTATDPFGVANNAWSVTVTGGGINRGIGQYIGVWNAGETGSAFAYLRVPSGSISTRLSAQGSDVLGSLSLTITTTWQLFELEGQGTSSKLRYWLLSTGIPDGAVIEVFQPQVNRGLAAIPYQRVGAASDYDSTAFPIFQKYDGVDDGMATAAFAAGTLIDGMDCMIAVRRDSAASCVAGLYNGVADATKFFGMAESASGSGCVGSGAGTPTVWVDNTQLTGGTAVTRGTLHTALTVGDWHILEFRNLDLSTWTAAGFGLYTSYVFPGPRGDIMLYPSTTSTEDKDAARQWLADYYGVTLP